MENNTMKNNKKKYQKKEMKMMKSIKKNTDNEGITISHLDIYASVRKTVPTKPSKYMESKKVYNRKDKSWKNY